MPAGDRRPVLDRVEFFDDRARDFPVSALLATQPVPRRQQLWQTRPTPLDQGREGACVGFAYAGELAAQPWIYSVDETFALDLYRRARDEDKAMGHAFAAGATLTAGARVCQRLGWIGEYRWAFGVDEVVDALISQGPVVLGIPWLEGMYETGAGGLVSVTGRRVGGHAILAHGYVPRHPTLGGEMVAWTNSWGSGYGLKGVGYIRVEDLGRLLSQNGEACVPTDRPAPGSEAGPVGGSSVSV